MAVLKNALIVASVLASCVVAIPVAAVHRRDVVTNVYTVTDWVTVNEQATVWVDGAGKPVKTDLPSVSGAVTVKPTSAAPSSTATTSSVAAPPVVAPAAPAPPAPVASSSSSSAPSATYSPAAFAASPAPSPAAPVAPAPAAPAPAPSSSAVLQKSSAGGPCEGQGSACTGDITHYDGGLGACGWNVNTASDMQIALPYALMGTQSNGNPYCGRSLSIMGSAGNIVQATVGDKCMGCEGDSIDLTDALFTAVAPGGDGRVHNIQWWFN